jgi:acyl-CoA thioesterase-2
MSSSGNDPHGRSQHRVDLEANPGTIEVRSGDEIIATSSNTLRVRESNHPDVIYFPREDVRADLIEPTDHSSFCPFKGHAAYWTVRVGGREFENAIWGYPEPIEAVAGLEGYMAFYADRFDWQSS